MKDVIWYGRDAKAGAAPNVVEPDKGKWEWVVFPEVDIFDKPHQPASLNGFKFERGSRYFCPPDVAAELRRLIATALKADMRLMQSTPDLKAVTQQRENTTTPGAGNSTFVRG